MNKKDRRNISRIKTGNTNGWQVRINRNNEQHSKLFSVKRFGGVWKALAAAQKYRESIIALAPAPSPGARKIRTGRHDGIRRTSPPNGKGNPAWVAQWVGKDGKRKTRSFSIAIHGELRAEQKARKARMVGVAGLDRDQKQKRRKVKSLDELLK